MRRRDFYVSYALKTYTYRFCGDGQDVVVRSSLNPILFLTRDEFFLFFFFFTFLPPIRQFLRFSGYFRTARVPSSARAHELFRLTDVYGRKVQYRRTNIGSSRTFLRDGFTSFPNLKTVNYI